MSLVRRLRHALFAAVAAVYVVSGLGAVAFAHPTAASFVVIHSSTPNAVTVTVTTEALSLLMKLEALAGRPNGAANATPAEADRRIRALGHVLLGQLELSFDGHAAPLGIQSLQRVAARPEQVQIVLTGTMPRASASLRWRTSLFFGSYPLAVRTPGTDPDGGSDDYEWLSGPEVSRQYSMSSFSPGESGWTRTGWLIAIGFTHIVPGGMDHVLFVLGLFLLAGGSRSLLLQISAFTLAHSLTLALAVAGWVSVPSRVVEPLIAVSIAYVAVENIFVTSISRWRLAIVFAFGLLHGLGFADALGALGLSKVHMASTLVGFNIGVELGQLAVVAAAALLMRALPLAPDASRRLIARPASAAIAATGIFWAMQRALY